MDNLENYWKGKDHLIYVKDLEGFGVSNIIHRNWRYIKPALNLDADSYRVANWRDPDNIYKMIEEAEGSDLHSKIVDSILEGEYIVFAKWICHPLKSFVEAVQASREEAK